MTINSIEYLSISSPDELKYLINDNINNKITLEFLTTHPFFDFDIIKMLIDTEVDPFIVLANIRDKSTYADILTYLLTKETVPTDWLADLCFWADTPADILHQVALLGYGSGAVINENCSSKSLDLILQGEYSEVRYEEVFAHSNYIPSPLPEKLYVFNKRYLIGVARNPNSSPSDLVKLATEFMSEFSDGHTNRGQKYSGGLQNIVNNANTPAEVLETMFSFFSQKPTTPEGSFYPLSIMFGILIHSNLPSPIFFDALEKALDNESYLGVYNHELIRVAATRHDLSESFFKKIKDKFNPILTDLLKNPHMPVSMMEELVEAKVESYQGLGQNTAAPVHVLRKIAQKEGNFFALKNAGLPETERAYYCLKNVLENPDSPSSTVFAKILIKIIPNPKQFLQQSVAETFDGVPNDVLWNIVLQLLKDGLPNESHMIGERHV